MVSTSVVTWSEVEGFCSFVGGQTNMLLASVGHSPLNTLLKNVIYQYQLATYHISNDNTVCACQWLNRFRLNTEVTVQKMLERTFILKKWGGWYICLCAHLKMLTENVSPEAILTTLVVDYRWVAAALWRGILFTWTGCENSVSLQICFRVHLISVWCCALYLGHDYGRTVILTS